MKNKYKSVALILIIFISFIALPLDINAVTLKEYEDQVAKYTAELKQKESQIAKNETEVAEIKKQILSIQAQIKTITAEKIRLQEEIEKCNREIAQKDKETKKIIEYLQLSNGENAYLEYAFGADSITDMIYRMSVAEQLAEYNDSVIKELNTLVEANKERKEELVRKDEQLTDLQKQLAEQSKKIEADTASIREGMPTTKQQIEQAQAMVTFYKNKGCKSTDVIYRDCAVVPKATPGSGGGSASNIASTGAFVRPIEIGYVSNDFGGNRSTLTGFHYGIDLTTSVNKSNTRVYPVANGTIYFKGYDSYGALIVRIAHSYNGKIVASTYVHLASFAPGIYVGQNVTQNDYIGIMGTSGYSTGIHLHLEMSDCPYLLAGSQCYGWNEYTRYLAKTNGPRDYITFPSSWSAR